MPDLLLGVDDYRKALGTAGPFLIVTAPDGQPFAALSFRWPQGLPEVLVAWTLSDAPVAELVMPSWLRPTEGDGAVCPCGGDPGCFGCGGSGVYRGAWDALIVYRLDDNPTKATVITSHGCRPMTPVDGLIFEAFNVARQGRRSRDMAIPVGLVVEGLRMVGQHVAVRGLR
jgi:hypothetical protein